MIFLSMVYLRQFGVLTSEEGVIYIAQRAKRMFMRHLIKIHSRFATYGRPEVSMVL